MATLHFEILAAVTAVPGYWVQRRRIISQFVFEENVESRLTDKIYEKVKDRDFESIDGELGKELSLAALMDIRRRMEG